MLDFFREISDTIAAENHAKAIEAHAKTEEAFQNMFNVFAKFEEEAKVTGPCYEVKNLKNNKKYQSPAEFLEDVSKIEGFMKLLAAEKLGLTIGNIDKVADKHVGMPTKGLWIWNKDFTDCNHLEDYPVVNAPRLETIEKVMDTVDSEIKAAIDEQNNVDIIDVEATEITPAEAINAEAEDKIIEEVDDPVAEKIASMVRKYIGKDMIPIVAKTAYQDKLVNTNTYDLTITDENGNPTVCYTIDCGTFIPCVFSVIVSDNSPTPRCIGVPIIKRYRPLLQTIFSKFYSLEVNEYNDIVDKYYVYNGDKKNAMLDLYAYVDFSNCKTISAQQRLELYKNLGNALSKVTTNETARYRFEKFKDYKNFVLVSDFEVKTPCPGYLSAMTISGQRITVKNGQVEKIENLDILNAEQAAA